MTLSSKSVLFFGVYLTGMGIGFVGMPNLLLGILRFPPTDEVWSRVVGMLALVLAFYYVQAARMNIKPFLQWTVYTRLAGFLFFVGFTVAGLAGPMMIVLGLVDLGSALWTEWALRKEKQYLSRTLPKQALA
jgi:hypothetical protein